jgi:glycosyltransferase involved in cell wall biosynthesis
VLHDGEDALLAQADNLAGIAEAVRALIGSTDLARSLSAAGRLNAARFTIEHTAEAYAALYRDLIANAGD